LRFHFYTFYFIYVDTGAGSCTAVLMLGYLHGQPVPSEQAILRMLPSSTGILIQTQVSVLLSGYTATLNPSDRDIPTAHAPIINRYLYSDAGVCAAVG
jgi:hypothetical protein